MSDFVSRFDLEQFKKVVSAELDALRARVARALDQPKRVIKGADGKDAVIDWHRVERKATETAIEAVAAIRPPKDGISIKGDPGPRGIEGPPGPAGKPGEMGPRPDHIWVDGTKLAFQNPDGEFEEPVQLKGEKGDPGGGVTAIAPLGGGPVNLEVFGWFPSGW